MTSRKRPLRALTYFKQIEFPKSPATNTTTETDTKDKDTEKPKEKEQKEKEKKTRKNKKAKTEITDQYSERTEVVNGIMVMNPYKNPTTIQIFAKFLQKYFADNNQRVFVLGINPGRLGAGLTGLDTIFGKSRKEPSGEFIHNFIAAYGGPKKFFSQFYITSACPLGFMKDGANYNFYDSKELLLSCTPFMLHSLRTQIPFGGTQKVAICLGTGKLATALRKINTEHKFFEKILEVEHPRYIVQYKSSKMKEYIEKYIEVFNQALQLSGISTTSTNSSSSSSSSSCISSSSSAPC